MALIDDSVRMDDSGPHMGLDNRLRVDATRDSCTLDEMLAMETCVARGELNTGMKTGTILYATHTCPSVLESTDVSRISYLSKLFLQWHGGFEFQFYITKTIYQETKILLVFLPGYTVDQARSVPVSRLMGFQNSLVFAPVSEKKVRFTVPFVSEANWVSTERATGAFVVVLLEPVIAIDNAQAKIPWILTVASPEGREKLVFRYSVPPPMQASGSTGGNGGGYPGEPAPPAGTGEDQAVATIGETYARSSSYGRTRVVFGANEYTSDSLYSLPGVGGTPVSIEYAIPVLLKGRNVEWLAKKLAQFELSPPFSFVKNGVVTRKSIVPFLPNIVVWGPQPNTQSGYPNSFDWWYSNSNNTIEGDGKVVYFGHTPGDFSFVVGFPSGLVDEFVGWRVVGLFAGRGGLNAIEFEVERSPSGIKLAYRAGGSNTDAGGLGVYVSSPLFFIDSPENYAKAEDSLTWPAILPWLRDHLTRAQQLGVTDYFYVYARCSEPSAGAIRQWLNEESDPVMGQVPPPKLVCGTRLSFSMSQAPWLFDRLYEASVQRGLLMWVFKLFGGNENTVIGKIVRVADVVFDLLVPALISYDGTAPIQSVVGMQMEYEQYSEEVRAEAVGMVPKFLEAPAKALTWAEVARRGCPDGADGGVPQPSLASAAAGVARVQRAIARLTAPRKSS